MGIGRVECSVPTDGIFGLNERIIDSHDIDIIMLDPTLCQKAGAGRAGLPPATHALRKTCITLAFVRDTRAGFHSQYDQCDQSR